MKEKKTLRLRKETIRSINGRHDLVLQESPQMRGIQGGISPALTPLCQHTPNISNAVDTSNQRSCWERISRSAEWVSQQAKDLWNTNTYWPNCGWTANQICSVQQK